MNTKGKKIAFIDRDGVINKKAPDHQYITKVEDFIFNKGIFDVCKRLGDDGFEFIIVTNQRGIARGLVSEKVLSDIHTYMKNEFQKKGIQILDVFYCPHEKDSCDCRKPKDGMLRKATARYHIDLKSSLLLSDSKEDLEMAEKFGVKEGFLVPADHPEDFLKQYQKKKIRIAFVKFGGLSAGGTEKFLQIIAANLPKDEFTVDYFYCNTAPYIGDPNYRHMDTDLFRVQYMKDHGVNLIQFHVGARDITVPSLVWRNTDFWEKFNESDYDIIQTGKAGHKEFPFTKIRRTPVVDSLHLSAGVDNQYNISRVMHICQWSADGWIHRGGDKNRVVLVSLPISIEDKNYGDLRQELGLEGKFIYGMHQRADNNIFSPMPLAAYKKIEDDNTVFVLLGGGSAYEEQARELGIKHAYFLPATGDSNKVFRFLNTLDVYAHGRKDGEVNSQSMAEAMYFGLPIVSHFSAFNNGHVECMGEAGLAVSTVDEYAKELSHLRNDKGYYETKTKAALKRFADKYELNGQIKNFAAIYRDAYKNPFPHPVKRFLSSLHYTQNIRVWAVWVYRKWKYGFRNKK